MIFRIDEHFPVEVSEMLQKQGYESITVMDQAVNGKDDPKIKAVCQIEDYFKVIQINLSPGRIPEHVENSECNNQEKR